MNFAPGGEFTDKESRMQRVLQFMEQRHYLALARQHGEKHLVKNGGNQVLHPFDQHGSRPRPDFEDIARTL